MGLWVSTQQNHESINSIHVIAHKGLFILFCNCLTTDSSLFAAVYRISYLVFGEHLQKNGIGLSLNVELFILLTCTIIL